MSLYAAPEPIHTDKRCQFALPNRKYNCRAVGRFLLGDKGYCAAHYDLAWRIQNPVFGQQHEWGLNGFFPAYRCCVKCGAIELHQGLPQSPCRGHLPRIVLSGSRGVVREYML